jgi:hypothetical protein
MIKNYVEFSKAEFSKHKASDRMFPQCFPWKRPGKHEHVSGMFSTETHRKHAVPEDSTMFP